MTGVRLKGGIPPTRYIGSCKYINTEPGALISDKPLGDMHTHVPLSIPGKMCSVHTIASTQNGCISLELNNEAVYVYNLIFMDVCTHVLTNRRQFKHPNTIPVGGIRFFVFK